MSRQLPLTVEAHKLAKQGVSLNGFLLLADLLRMADMLETDSGQVNVNLRFEIGSDRLHYVHGHITGEIQINCQRCMEAMTTVVDNKFVLGLMDNPEIAKRLPEDIDPVFVDQGELSIPSMIEDELILALPLISMHELQDCSARDHMQVSASNKENTEQGRKENPFAILKDLK